MKDANSAKSPTKMSSSELQDNILSTYFTLRAGIVVMAFALPVILYVVGWWNGIPSLLPSMSAYYGDHDYAVRDWFVGILCTVGAFLYLYKGFSTRENILLNLAGIFAIGVAMIPCNCWDAAKTWPRHPLHFFSAVSFFVAMAAVAFFCAGETLSLLPNEATRKAFRRRYNAISAVLILSPAGALFLTYVLHIFDRRIFFIEAFGVWTFGYYWWTKSREFRITAAEKRAAYGELKHVRGRGVVPAREPD